MNTNISQTPKKGKAKNPKAAKSTGFRFHKKITKALAKALAILIGTAKPEQTALAPNQETESPKDS